MRQGREVAPAPAFSDQVTRVMGGASGPISPLEATQVRRSGQPPASVSFNEERSHRRSWLPWLLLVLFLLVLAGGACAVVNLMGRDTNPAVVPNLLGLTLEQAQKEGARVGLKVVQGGASEMSGKYDKGQIMRQDPEEASNWRAETPSKSGCPQVRKRGRCRM